MKTTSMTTLDFEQQLEIRNLTSDLIALIEGVENSNDKNTTIDYIISQVNNLREP